MKVFQPAPERSTAANVARTLVQTTMFWTVFIVVLPSAIHAGEQALGLPAFTFPGHRIVAAIVFAGMTAMNLGSGIVMAIAGRGTPFPADTARALVVRGPYRYLRNPMSFSGLGVGIAIALWLGSWPIIGYVVVGGLMWHLIARPMEERDLEERFGESYRRYRTHVRTWIPRITSYEP
ncbi:MAG: isoprenylcysteine carboxylmethyltransferase family protein [Kofleriaceae bacterium]